MSISIKKIISPINTTEDFFDEFDFGVIELTQANIDRIRTMAEIVRTASETVSDVRKLTAWDNSITVMKADEDCDVKDLDNGRFPLKEPEFGCIDCVMLHVTQTEFYWTFHPKHSNILCETEEYRIMDLDNFETIDERNEQHVCPGCEALLEFKGIEVLHGISHEVYNCPDCELPYVKDITNPGGIIEYAVPCVMCHNYWPKSSAHMIHEKDGYGHFIGECCWDDLKGGEVANG